MNNVSIVRAGAGSGKTHRLADELYEAVTRADNQVRPQAVVLTTFTRKAAAELMGRVYERLVQQGETEKARLFGQARVGTVNSVCGRILEQFAFDAGMPVEQTVLADGQQEVLFEQALSRAIDDAALAHTMEVLDMRLSIGTSGRTGKKKASWRGTVHGIAQLARANAIPPSELPACAARSCALITAACPTGSVSYTDFVKALQPAIDGLQEAIDGGDTTKKTADTLTAVRMMQRACAGDGPRWQDVQYVTRLEAGLNSRAHWEPPLHNLKTLAADHCAWPELTQCLCDYVTKVFDLAAKVLDEYQVRKDELGVIDFVDQEVQCLELLRNERVRKALEAQVDMVLVDEFQDTSPIQLAIFCELASIAGSSLWVGDPKQSVFGFRGTDPEIILRAVQHVKNLPGCGEGARQPTSYRSVPPLVQCVNTCFATAFDDQGLAPADVTLDPHRTETLDGPSLESWVLAKGGRNKQPASIAAGVEQVLAEGLRVYVKGATKAVPLRPSHIGILARSNEQCDAIACELTARGIPVERSVGGLLERPAVRLALAGLSLLCDPSDTLAAASVTWLTDVAGNGMDKGEWLGGRLAELQQRRGKEGDQKEFGAWSSHATIRALRAAAEEASTLPVRRLLTLAMELTNAHVFAARCENPRQANADLDALLVLAESYEQEAMLMGSALSGPGLLRYLDRLAENGDDMVASSGTDAVTVTTWHRAKGLEWPFVVLCGCDISPKSRFHSPHVYSLNDDFSVDNPLAGRAIRFVPFAYGSDKAAANYVSRLSALPEYARQQQLAEQENLRLLYVGFTRARDVLAFAMPENAGTIPGIDNFVIPRSTDEAGPGWRIRMLSPDMSTSLTIDRDTRWYPYTTTRTERPAAHVAPSSLTAEPSEEVTVGEPLGFGERIPVARGADPAVVGTAVHAYLAVDTAALDDSAREEIARRLLTGYDLDAIVDPTHIVTCAANLEQWIAARWPDALAHHREWPVLCRIDGRTIEGTVDRVVELEDSFIVIDHKTYPGSRDQARSEAGKYAPQLAAYAEAVGRGLGKRCGGTYISFAVGGFLVEVEMSSRAKMLGCAADG